VHAGSATGVEVVSDRQDEHGREDRSRSPAVNPPRSALRDTGTYVVLLGSVTGGVGALVFQVVAGRSLGAESFAPISTIWTLLFLINTVVLLPVEQYITRELASSRPPADRVLALPVVLATLASAAVVAWNLASVFASDPVYLLLTAVLVASLALAARRRGQLAGTRAFVRYGVATMAQTALLLLLGVAANLGQAAAPAFAAALVVSPLATLLVRVSPTARSALARTEARTADGPGAPSPDGPAPPATARFVGPYIVATASAQTLLAAAPVAVLFLGGSPEQISVTFVVFTLLRAPLTLLYAVQARLLPSLVGWAERGDAHRLRRFATRAALASVPTAVLGAVVGAAAGPAVIALLYGADFRPSAVVVSAVVAGVLLATGVQLVALVIVARGTTTQLAVSWPTGLAAACVTLLVLPGDAVTRVAIAFLVGQAVALALMAALATRWPGHAAATSGPGRSVT
jgi:O-antigen/teichoic acid export membrane protein